MHKSKARHIQLMKKYTTLALIGAIVAGVAGLISIDAISETSLVTMQGASDFHESGLMIGHVTYEVRGADGQVKHYLQGDNLITRIGTDCAAIAIFGGTVPSCPTPGDFAFIAIGNGTAGASPLDTKLSIGGTNAGEMDRSPKITAAISQNSGSGTVVTLSNSATPFTFTKLRTGDQTNPSTIVTQSGVFDAATVGNMFSIKDIPPPSGGGIKVTNADTLAVTWTITLTSGP